MRRQGELDPSKLIFIDESATKTNMTRLRGRSPRGERLRMSAPCGHWKKHDDDLLHPPRR